MLYRPRYAPSGRAFTEPEIVFKHVIITRGYGDIIWPFLEMNSKRLTKEWFDDLRLSLSEQLMLRLLMAGMTMEEVAVNLNTSLKSLYRKRTALYERLGLDNFNEACLFIFRNKLLEQTERSL